MAASVQRGDRLVYAEILESYTSAHHAIVSVRSDLRNTLLRHLQPAQEHTKPVFEGEGIEAAGARQKRRLRGQSSERELRCRLQPVHRRPTLLLSAGEVLPQPGEQASPYLGA